MFKCYLANRNEFLRDSSRIEPIPPNIRNAIVSESGLTRRTSRLEKIFNETSRILPPPPESKKNQFVAIRAIRGLCGIGVLHVYHVVHVDKYMFKNCSLIIC